jgi:hypothetical protein
MTIFMFANNVDTTLAGPISSTATSMTLASAAHLPTSIPSGQVLVVTLNDVATLQNFEVMYATAVSGATLSGLLRGQEGTPALAWSTGDFAYSAPTAGQQGSFGQKDAANVWTGANTFNDAVVVGAATVSGDAVQLGQVTNTSSPLQLATAAATSPNQSVNLGQFPSSLTSNGWKKYPDPNSPSGYFIEQWGSVVLGNGANQRVALPISYPNAHLWAGCSYASVPSTNTTCGAAPNDLSSLLIGNASPGTNQILYQSKGY